MQLHSGVGLGNALGSLYHALRRQTPMVVMAGEAGVAYDALEAHMAVDLVAIARPVTKYATRAIHPGSLLRLLRRCLKIAATAAVRPGLPRRAAGHPRSAQRRAGGADGRSRDTGCVPDAGAVRQRRASCCAGGASPVILVGRRRRRQRRSARARRARRGAGEPASGARWRPS